MFPLLISTPPPRVGTFRIEQVAWDDGAGRKLRDEQVAEISARFGTPPENAPGIPPSADNITLFLLAYPENADDPVACGALRHLEDGFMEIKRMYATPESRGTGAALCVLLALEKYARSLDVKGLKLETATLQPDAIRQVLFIMLLFEGYLSSLQPFWVLNRPEFLPRTITHISCVTDGKSRFYQKHGYEEIPQFGYYIGVPWSRCFLKTLAGDAISRV